MIESSGIYSTAPNQVQNQVMEWRQAPFSQVAEIEVLDNMRLNNESLESHYKRIRKDILTPPFSESTLIGVMGLSGVGKGGFGMGIYKLLREDAYLRDSLAKEGIELDVLTMPFAMYLEASRLDEVREEHPVFQTFPYGSAEYYAEISKLMWGDVERFFLKKKKKKRVVLIEPSSPTGAPTQVGKIPVDVTGIDRGNSVLYNSAVHPKSRARTFIHAIEGDREVIEGSQEKREKIQEGKDLQVVFDSTIRYVYTASSGERVNISDLPAEQQLMILDFLKKCMAPPHIMQRHKEELASLRQSLGLPEDEDTSFYEYLRKKLGYRRNDNHFSILTNEHSYINTTVDLDYFFDSLPVRLYPEILGDIAR